MRTVFCFHKGALLPTSLRGCGLWGHRSGRIESKSINIRAHCVFAFFLFVNGKDNNKKLALAFSFWILNLSFPFFFCLCISCCYCCHRQVKAKAIRRLSFVFSIVKQCILIFVLMHWGTAVMWFHSALLSPSPSTVNTVTDHMCINTCGIVCPGEGAPVRWVL